MNRLNVIIMTYMHSVMFSVSDPPLGRSPPLRHASRAASPASTGEHTPGRVVYRGEYITVISSPQVLPFREILRKFARDDRLVFGFLPPY